MSDKLILSWNDTDALVGEVLRQIAVSNWTPTRVVGIARGGLPAATMISHYYGAPMTALHVCLRDNHDTESNLWLAEMAFGYCDTVEPDHYDPSLREQILIVDDICDSGATQQWIKEDWAASCLPRHDGWNTVWHHNVRFASLVHNQGSGIDSDYAGKVIDKREKDVWVEFPWENWWRR